MSLTQEEVEKIVKDKGCILLDTFKNKKSKLKIQFQ